jgi:hypothetical protein
LYADVEVVVAPMAMQLPSQAKKVRKMRTSAPKFFVRYRGPCRSPILKQTYSITCDLAF